MLEPKDVNIFLVGDFMLDKYIVGDVERISPEAPVPIVKVTNEFATLGGAGNVARNLRAIGTNVRCVGLIGHDYDGIQIKDNLDGIGASHRMIEELATTTVKTRIIADERKIQMLRLDEEDIIDPDAASELIIEIINQNFSKDRFNYIVVSDYAKGTINQQIMIHINQLGVPVIVDPKPVYDYYYGRVELMTPNSKEYKQMFFDKRCSSEFILVTEGKDGMTLIDNRQGHGTYKIKGEEVEVYNVSGAGDTVVAVMATCMAMGLHPAKAAIVANKCAAYVVTKPGTSIITENKFTDIVKSYIA